MPSSLASVRPMLRSAYARAVHESVCQFTDSDGFGRCDLYAIGGFTILVGEKLTPMAQPHTGTLLLLPDPDQSDHWFSLDATDGGIDRGECHVWLGAEDRTVIDFSARHYRKYTEALPVHTLAEGSDSRPSWRRPEPPEYIWSSYEQVPSWVRLNADRESCMAFNDRFLEMRNDPSMVEFRRLIWRNLLRLKPR